MTPGFSEHPFPNYFADHQIRHQTIHTVGSQPGDCIWSLIFVMGLCGYVWVNILTSSPPEGRGGGGEGGGEGGREREVWFALFNDTWSQLCLGPIGDFCIGDGEKNNYTRDASQCLAILSINTSRLFAEGSVIPPEHRLMLVNFHRECIGDAKKSPVGPSHKHIQCHVWPSFSKLCCRSPDQTPDHTYSGLSAWWLHMVTDFCHGFVWVCMS